MKPIKVKWELADVAGTTFQQILGEAKRGTLTFPEFIVWWNTVGAWEDSSQNVPEVQQLLTALKANEPNAGFVKGNQIQIVNGQVEVFMQTTPAYPGQGIIGGAAQGADKAVEDLKGIGKWFVKNLARIGEIVVGVVIVGVATAAVVKGKR